MLNPTNIERSNKTYEGKPAIVFTGENNGRMNIVAVVSDKRLDLFVQTAYVNTKKENLATPIDEQASINTPEANDGTVFSKNSIPQKEDAVNRQFSLTSELDGEAIDEARIVRDGRDTQYSLSVADADIKQKQLRIIENTNPAPNSYQAWVRSDDDIKTLRRLLRRGGLR